ncbi:MAG: serine/threonine protein kinase [Thiohalocapsa sp.]|nr:serine/threonine protein kinase [Thiohalocapsa sp.]
MTTLKTPERLGKYRIDGILGQGAMGTVYRGYDIAIDRAVALKTIHSHLLEAEDVDEYVRRFQQEARAAARCDHPNIVTIYDVGVEDETPFMAMELVEGRSLKSCLARNERFRAEDAAAIMLQILAGLQYAHAHGVVHRDIKPPNIMVLLSGTAKLTDFGVARIDSTQATQIGAVLGTPAYMSPEQLLGRAVTAASDLYAVAVVLTELVSGIRPQPGGAQAIVARLRIGDPVKLPAAFLDLLERGLRDSPAARFASAAEMAAAIEHSLDERTALDLMSGLAPCKADDPTSLGELPPRPGPDAAFSWAPEVLATIERELSEYIGPLAKLLVRKHARGAKDVDALSGALAAQIADAGDRERFLRRFRDIDTDPGVSSGSHFGGARAASPGTGTGSGGTAAPADPPTLEPIARRALEERLADYVGPMARMLIRTSLKEATTLDDLHARLARAIPDDDQRRAFLRSLQRN